GLLADEQVLRTGSGRAPDRQAAVAVVVVHVGDEGLLVPHEPRGRAVAQPLRRLGHGEAQRAHAIEGIVDRAHRHIFQHPTTGTRPKSLRRRDGTPGRRAVTIPRPSTPKSNNTGGLVPWPTSA